MASSSQSKVDQYNELMSTMSKAKEKWDEDEGIEDPTDQMLSQALDLAIQQGKGWGAGEKEAYLEKILDDDFIPPIFASTPEELEKSGLQEAFTSLIYDNETPTSLMFNFRKKGNEAFASAKRSETGNMTYYRNAINFYYEAIACAQKIEPMQPGDLAQADTDDQTFTEQELDEEKAKICANVALCHMQLKNWGYARTECQKALEYSKSNVKIWYRLAKANQMLQKWEEAGDAIESGLAVKGEEENKDLKKLQRQLAEKVRKARLQRQQRERARAERVANVKSVWKHCSSLGITLGRVPLITSVTEEEEDDDERVESRWLSHLPNSGQLPKISVGEAAWPVMLLYPSHNQSDFIKGFGEGEMMALRMADVFPELEDEGQETAIPWDYNNEFVCSQLAVYFEVHANDDESGLTHPDNVSILKDQASCMRFYESTRALKGDEGPEMAEVVRAVERKALYKQRKAWKKKHGSLWAKPDANPVVRVHPAMTLRDILVDSRMVVPNFIPTFTLFPEKHPAHDEYLKEHKCIGALQPEA